MSTITARDRETMHYKDLGGAEKVQNQGRNHMAGRAETLKEYLIGCNPRSLGGSLSLAASHG
jgi:hypothetical protein